MSIPPLRRKHVQAEREMHCVRPRFDLAGAFRERVVACVVLSGCKNCKRQCEIKSEIGKKKKNNNVHQEKSALSRDAEVESELPDEHLRQNKIKRERGWGKNTRQRRFETQTSLEIRRKIG